MADQAGFDFGQDNRNKVFSESLKASTEATMLPSVAQAEAIFEHDREVFARKQAASTERGGFGSDVAALPPLDVPDFLNDVKNFAIGVPSNFAGTANDLLAMSAIVHDSGFEYLLKDPKEGGFDFLKVPGGGEMIGDVFGADPKSKAFLASAFFNPEGPLLAGLKAAKLFMAGAKVAGGVGTVLHATGLGARTAHLAPGGVERLTVADKMRQAGKADDEIFQSTGWFYDPEEKLGSNWKFYLSDADVTTDLSSVERVVGDHAIGEEFAVTTDLKNVIKNHVVLDTFENAGNIPITLWAKRLPDKLDNAGNIVPDYKLYNTAADEVSINAQITVDSAENIHSMDVFSVPKGSETPKSVIMHEVNHIVEQINAQDMGTSTQKFHERVMDAAAYAERQRIGRAVERGDLTPESTLDDIQDFINDLGRKQSMPEETAQSLAATALRNEQQMPGSPRILTGRQRWEGVVHAQIQKNLDMITADEAAFKAILQRQQIWADRTMRDVRIMMEELGELRPGKEAKAMAESILNKMSPGEQHLLAFRRYRGQTGEIGSRLTEAFIDTRQADILALPESPFSPAGRRAAGVDAPPRGGITGDAARASPGDPALTARGNDGIDFPD